MDLTEEQVIWGAATTLLRRHGPRTRAMVAERIKSLEDEGDELGCALWTAIARCMDDLSQSPVEH